MKFSIRPTMMTYPRAAAVAASIFLLAASALRGQSCPSAATLTKGVPQPLATVRYLADDALEGRLAGTAGERCAGNYIAAQFRALGLEPAGDKATFFQSLPLASIVNPHAPPGAGRNVVAILPGSDPRLKDEAVVIGAHYDHLGMGGFGALDPDSHEVHNGADDNASGVAALIDAARRLSKGPRPARSVVFVAFTGEEEGLLGSSYYTAHPVVPNEKTRAMINMDMVGRLNTGNLLVYGIETAAEWKEIVGADIAREGPFSVTYRGEGYGPSDQTSFYSKDIPVLHFFTNLHTDYHRATDDWQKIDGPGIGRVASVVADVARDVANRPLPLTVAKGLGKPTASDTAAQSQGYGAYLGSIPDFTPVEHGVKLSGVRAGSPAAKAGFRGGDIIVKFDDDDVKDLYVLTAELRKHKAGDTVQVTVLRDGKEVTAPVTLGTR